MGIREIPEDLWELNFLAVAQMTSLSWMPLRTQGKENEREKKQAVESGRERKEERNEEW